MANVTKKNLVEVISGRTGLTQVDTKIIVENLLDTISGFLSNGKNIEIRGFGRFKIKTKKERIARNPRTGETVKVDQGFKPIFEASKELKKKVNEGKPITSSISENIKEKDQAKDASAPIY